MGLTEDWMGRTELTRAILKKDTALALLKAGAAPEPKGRVAARQNAKYLVPGPIAEYMKTYPKRTAQEEGV